MEIISIERSTYEVIGLPLRLSKNSFVTKMKEMAK